MAKIEDTFNENHGASRGQSLLATQKICFRKTGEIINHKSIHDMTWANISFRGGANYRILKDPDGGFPIPHNPLKPIRTA